MPPDHRLRELLDGLDPERCADLFPRGLDAVREPGAHAPCQHLGDRLPVALDGLQIHCSDTLHWALAGADLDCLLWQLGADFLCVCQPTAHQRIYELLRDKCIHCSGWVQTGHGKQPVEQHHFRWLHGLPVRASAAAVLGSRVAFGSQRIGSAPPAIRSSPASQSRPTTWPRPPGPGAPGYNIQRSCGHGSNGWAHVLATLNLFASARHPVLECVAELWQQSRSCAGTRHNFFAPLDCFTQWFCFDGWTELWETAQTSAPERSAGGGRRAGRTHAVYRQPASDWPLWKPGDSCVPCSD